MKLPGKSVMDDHEDNFAIVFAAMGVCILKRKKLFFKAAVSNILLVLNRLWPMLEAYNDTQLHYSNVWSDR